MGAARQTSAREKPGEKSQPRYQPLIVVLLAAVAGICIDRFGREVVHGSAFIVWIALAGLALVAWWIVWRPIGEQAFQSRREFIAAWLLLASVLLTAAAWHELRWNYFARDEIARFATHETHPACVEAIALEPPELLPAPTRTALRAIPASERSQLDVQVVSIRDGAEWQPANGKCQFSVVGTAPRIVVGDRLRMFGQLGRVSPPRNPGEFDFAEFARADGKLVRLVSSVPEAVSVVAPAAWSPRRLLDSVRRAGHRFIAKSVGAERSGLASAILLGAREGLTREETNSYLVTGTIHLLVVSGMNVAILAFGLHLAARWGLVGRRTGLAIVMAIVVAYALVTGGQPPVVRAAVIAVLWCIAAWSGRRGRGFNALSAAALIVLALNPADLFRAGPQLSFLAVATLIWLNEANFWPRQSRGDRLDQMISAARPWPARAFSQVMRWNGWLLFTTFVVWATALPLVLLRFHVLTPVTILISPAVWLVVLVALWSGFLMLLVGWMFSPLGDLLGAVCNESLAGLESIVSWAEALPAGHTWTPGPAWWWVIGFYIGLVAMMLWRHALPPVRWQVAVLCAWLVVGFVPPVARALTRNGLEVAFVSVGHGACVMLQAPGGETILYDAGSLGSPETATRTVASYLWHRGITRLDGIVISHADVDHYNAVPGLLEQFGVGAIYVSPVMFQGSGFELVEGDAKTQAEIDAEFATVLSGPAELRRAIDRAGVPIRPIWAGDRLRLGPEVAIEVLHPPRRGVIGNDNANSITMMVEYDDQRVLLPGDLESPGLEDLMAELPRDCDVLLAPHHGSARSDPPGFATWSTPEWVVVSCGNADVRRSIRSYELAGATAFQTNLSGTVEFAVGKGETRVATWRARGGAIRVGR